MLSKDFRQSRVVIVDDVIANSRLLESSLRAFGLRDTISFSDSAAALDWLQHNPWSLLLLDLDMPAPNGFDILRAVLGIGLNFGGLVLHRALLVAGGERHECGGDHHRLSRLHQLSPLGLWFAPGEIDRRVCPADVRKIN